MPRKTKNPGPNRNRPMECEVCGFKVRVSRGPYARLTAQWPERDWLCKCGGRISFTKVEDAAAVSEAELERHPEYAKEQERWVKQVLSEPRGSGARFFQCGGCKKIINSPTKHCPCGFRNDIQGPRNHGGYADLGGPAGRSDDVPF